MLCVNVFELVIFITFVFLGKLYINQILNVMQYDTWTQLCEGDFLIIIFLITNIHSLPTCGSLIIWVQRNTELSYTLSLHLQSS